MSVSALLTGLRCELRSWPASKDSMSSGCNLSSQWLCHEVMTVPLQNSLTFNILFPLSFNLLPFISHCTLLATFACSYGGKPWPDQHKTNKSNCPWQVNLSYNCEAKLWALIDTSHPHLCHSNHTLDVDAAKRKR